MTIEEYYKNYKTNKKYPIKLRKGNDTTIDDFYNNCLKQNLLKKDNVLAWHKMLVEYSKRKDAIFWVRYYESGSKINGRWNNRRACVTRFKDGFSYVFVSNFDVHEILNMIRLGVDPNIDEFAELMSSFKYPMHYDRGKSCEESDIKAYPNIGTPRGGILTFEHWYLAHVNDIKSEFLRDDGTYRAIKMGSNEEGNRIYPRGSVSDWKLDKSSGKMIRELPYSLTPEEKKLVKAHFLRFIDPLNYYVTPGPKYESNSVCSRIGEYGVLNNFILSKFEILYGSSNMDDFRKEALVKKPVKYSTGGEIINIEYGVRTPITRPLKSSPAKIAAAKVAVKSAAATIKNKIGQYAKNIFEDLLNKGKLNSLIISNLTDKNYCNKELSISYPVLVDTINGGFDTKRYYKNIVLGKFRICSQWTERNRTKLDNWLKVNKF